MSLVFADEAGGANVCNIIRPVKLQSIAMLVLAAACLVAAGYSLLRAEWWPATAALICFVAVFGAYRSGARTESFDGYVEDQDQKSGRRP